MGGGRRVPRRDGALTINGGGDLRGGGYVGYGSTSPAVATVSGSGSTWDASGESLQVGFAGKGELNIESGGVVSCSTGRFGDMNSSSDVASVTVTGSGSPRSARGGLADWC